MAGQKQRQDRQTPPQASFPSGSRRGYVPPLQAQHGQHRQMTPGFRANPAPQQMPWPGQAPQQPYTGYPSPPFRSGQQPPHYAAQPQSRYAGQPPQYDSRGGYIPPARPPVQPAPPRNRNLLALLLLLPVILLLVILGINASRSARQQADEQQRAETIHSKVDPYASLFCPGISVDGISLGGMTMQEAKDAVESQVRQQSGSWTVRLTYGTSYKDITADMLNFTTDVDGVLRQAWQRGHTGDDEQRYHDMLQLEQEPCAFSTARPSGDTRVIDDLLAAIKTFVDKPAQDAWVSLNKDDISNPFVFGDEQYGLSLDTEPLREKLYQMVSVLESGTLEIVPDRIAPAVLKSDLMAKYSRRSTAFTKISTSSTEERNNNIRHAFQDYINGYRLAPGETFSFNKVVGERTQERGFFLADEFVSGETQKGYGGGVCQASTTLYQAAVCAGLQIVKRQPHSEKVNYTEFGLDATVYLTRNRNKDLSFKNTTNSDIYIFAVVEKDPTEKKKNRLRTRVDIYGEDMGNLEYQMRSSVVETIDPPTPEIRKDKKGEYVTYKDEQYLYSEARPGCKVDVFLTETRSGQEMYLYTDEYPARRAVYYEGVKNR